jgi:hypothetical protein
MGRTAKLAYRWRGPYRVRTANPAKGYYELEEFDGTKLDGTFAGNRLKKFILRAGDSLFTPNLTDTDEDSSSTEGTDDGSLFEDEPDNLYNVDALPDLPEPPRSKIVIRPPVLSEEQKRLYRPLP